MTEPRGEAGEQRPSYRTLNEPTRLIGLSLGSWAAVIVTGALGYAFVSVSPLPWRLNVSTVAILLGAPLAVLVLREPGTIGPGRLVLAALAWRARPPRVVPPAPDELVRAGGVRLDAEAELVHDADVSTEVPWGSEADG